MAIEIITTTDGSHSLFHSGLNETYHSRHGAIQESAHVFIEHGLNFLLNKGLTRVRIFEVGFGTGLNALLTLQTSQQIQQTIDYVSVEAFPLEQSVYTQLNYGRQLQMTEEFEKLHDLDWNTSHVLAPNFTIKKVKDSLHSLVLENGSVDLIYFDAFAPDKQPDMWTPDVLQSMFDALSSGGVFVTYCAKGQLKRDLKSIGFEVQTLPGPPGKKEMTRALKSL